MARPTRWDRRYSPLPVGGAAASYTNEIGRLQPGETLTRVRFQYDLSRALFNQAFFPDGLIWAVGIQVTPTTAAPTTNPIDDPNLDWVWWEGTSPRTIALTINSANANTIMKCTAPWPPDTRDGKAQRHNDSAVAQSVWLQARAVTQSGQADMFFSWSSSVLVIEAI